MVDMWAGEWHSNSLLDGERRHILYENRFPALFHTRRACREYINDKYGYIKTRPDLRTEPHGWRMPQPVKVEVVKVNK